MKRLERIDRIRAVERECLLVGVAFEKLAEALRANPSLLKAHSLSRADAANLSENLEATFLVRLFAEFEAGLRDAWTNCYGRTSEPPISDVIAGIASKARIPADRIDAVHEVRRYRNLLVHEGAEEAAAIELGKVRNVFCTFLSHLPETW